MMLTTITVQVPKEFGEMFAESGQTLYVEAMRDAIVRRLTSTEQRLTELRTQIARYESKYRRSYAEFSRQCPDSLEAHNDWMDWSYLVRITNTLRQRIEKLKFLTGIS